SSSEVLRPGRRVMDRLTRMLAGLLRCLAGLLGEHRRAWVYALLAEIGDRPTPSARLAWLGGGLWLVAREVLMNRLLQALANTAGTSPSSFRSGRWTSGSC